MNKEQTFYEKLADEFSRKDKNIDIMGKMMSCSAIKYKGKVFAFYSKKEVIFRLGNDFDIKKEGVKKFSYLSPFKNKPPMKSWFVVPYSEKGKWRKLAEKALEHMKQELQ